MPSTMFTREQWLSDIEDVFSPDTCDTLFKYMVQKDFRVYLEQSEDFGTGELSWNVVVYADPNKAALGTLVGFLLCTFDTRREATDFCRIMGWKITDKQVHSTIECGASFTPNSKEN